MSEMKLGKRKYMTVVQSEKCDQTRRATGEGYIWTIHQYFSFRVKHKKGSTRPAGTMHNLWSSSDAIVGVEWLNTDDLGYFAPEITFKPTPNGIKISQKVSKALYEMRNTEDQGPEALAEKLEAYVVEYINDNKKDTWEDYRVLQAPNEPAMMTVARYAS